MVTWKVTCTLSLPTPTNTSNGHLAILNIPSTAFHIAWPSDSDVYVPLRKLYPPELPNLNTISLNRGYPAKIIDEQIQKAVSVPRSEALQYQEKKSCNRVPFVVTYHPTHSTIASTIHKYLPILHTSSRCKEAIPEPPMVAFRRPTNIKDLVVRSSLKAPSTEATNTGFSPCKQCTACKHQHGEHRIQHTVSSNSITSTTTGERKTSPSAIHSTVYPPISYMSSLAKGVANNMWVKPKGPSNNAF